MKKEIKTFKSDNHSSTCLICETTYRIGKQINPQPSCTCGNIPFFDITPHYVRIAISWPLVVVNNDNDWKSEILSEIKEFGSPKSFRNIPDKYDYNR
ncbi:hypothetical protein [Maribacter sp. Asnod2-G09]|uniref:hypothetical protein n=1 Tax=Maribacter sp. Asnod2-G09 TaxID=3160577 RepID=UPI00386997A8